MQPAFKSGDIWITYSWQDQWYYGRTHKPPDQFDYMQPSQGRLGWFCGFMLGKDTAELLPRARVRGVLHQPRRRASQLTNLFAYGTPTRRSRPARSRTRRCAKSLNIGDPNALGPEQRAPAERGSRTRSPCSSPGQKVQAALSDASGCSEP